MTEQPLLHSFQESIHKNHLIERGEKLIVAVSGGIDSMVLLDLLSVLKKRLKLDLAVAHFNHQLRGKESDDDEAFVRLAANDRSLVCYVESADTKQIAETEKLSIQEAARNLRYHFLTKLRRSHGCQKIATAHNADDNAETIILNLIRGTGVHGLTGIPIRREDQLIIRPLLFATRECIQKYASEHHILYREDSSNLKNDYTRNFLRHKLLPLIRENINPNLTATLGRSSELFLKLEAYLNSQVEPKLKKIIERQTVQELSLNLKTFLEQPVFIQEQILHRFAKIFTSSEIDYGTVRSMMDISHGDTGSSCSISQDVKIYRDRNHLIFRRTPLVGSFSYTVEINKKYKFDNFLFESSEVSIAKLSKNPNIEYIDRDAVDNKFSIRSWYEGDWFIPLGMRDRKKVSDFFIDQKIPLFEKQTVPILFSDENIVWICGKRLDNRYKIKPKTKYIIKLKFTSLH